MKIGNLKALIVRRFDAMSTGGLLLGSVFFAVSLTPSLLPRADVLQGLLSGSAFAVGYGIGSYLQWLWGWLGFRMPSKAFGRRVRTIVLVLSFILAVVFLLLSSGWQNEIRAAMDMPLVGATHMLSVALVAIVPATVLIFLGWLAVSGVDRFAKRLKAFLPRRVAFAASLALVALAVFVLVNGLLVKSALRAVDGFYAGLDALAGQYEVQPTDDWRTGSAASLIGWETVGRGARGYIIAGPTGDEIQALTGRSAKTPLRVYVGLRSADTIEARADLALRELKRVGAFDRSVLVLAMPVGTGWVDPVGIDTLEILHGGDVASVALQYSYLTSWISLLVEPDVGVESARALFSAVYSYWTTLPRDARPRLYLYGMSLGAYTSQAAVQLYDVLDDPFQGALWVGPPFTSNAWRSLTSERAEGSRAWLPVVGNSSTVRFANQYSDLDADGLKWGPVRIVYLQYASDPIVFFDAASVYRRPAWLKGERAPDVSPSLQWFPLVTTLQLGLDLALSQSAPIGYGHVYAPQHYIDAWVAVTEPAGWDEASLVRLKQLLTRTGPIEKQPDGWFRESLGAASGNTSIKDNGSAG